MSLWALTAALLIFSTVTHLVDFKEDAVAEASVGIVGPPGQDWDALGIVAGQPSVDFEMRSRNGRIDATFRVNVLDVESLTDDFRVGFVIPSATRITAMGADGATRTITSRDTGDEFWGVACETDGSPGSPLPASDLINFVDTAGNSYELDCREHYAIAWIIVPVDREPSGAYADPSGRQRIASQTAAHIIASFPDGFGLSRLSFDQWRAEVVLETGLYDFDEDSQSYEPVSQATNAPATFPASICGISEAFPSSYNELRRIYGPGSNVPVSPGPCPTWDVPTDGQVHVFSGLARSSWHWWAQQVATNLGLLLLGAAVGPIFLSPTQVFRRAQKAGRN